MTPFPPRPSVDFIITQANGRPSEIYARFLLQLMQALAERDQQIAGLQARTELVVKSGAPAVGDVPDGQFRVIKNTTGPTYSLVVNDGGSLKSVALT